MQRLTEQGWRKVNEIARRHGVSTDAAMSMLQAVVNGNGTQAQFHVPELGGAGQWMRGGMTMVGDMFNHGLKSRVDALCNDLAQLLAEQPFAPAPRGGPSQWQGGESLFDPGPSGGAGSWWPAELGSPAASGGQNNARYAYFSDARRLAVETGENVTVYDTLDHRIGGASQQRGSGGSLTLTSQHGTVDVASLPVVSGNDASRRPSPPDVAPRHAPPSQPASPGGLAGADILATIERLADLRAKGILSQEEFAAKKSELLGRL